MNITWDLAYKLGCGRLIFEHGAISLLGNEAKCLGRHAFLLGGRNALAQGGKFVEHELVKSGVKVTTNEYSGPCSEEKAMIIRDMCHANGCDIIVGIGGGRIMDLCKIVANISDIPLINIPTISATCAAYTPLSVVYTPEGRCRGTWYFKREVDCLICDLDLLSIQPKRYLAAGFLDAMAKHIEIQHHIGNLSFISRDFELANKLAKIIFDDLMILGKTIFTSAEKVHQTEFERGIFNVIITTGLVSGIARGRYQSALAHALYEAIRTLYTTESAPFLHGEIVAIGLLLQTHYSGLSNEADVIKQIMKAAKMPLTLKQIGVQGDLSLLVAHDPVPQFFINGDIDSPVVYKILKDHLS